MSDDNLFWRFMHWLMIFLFCTVAASAIGFFVAVAVCSFLRAYHWLGGGT